MRSACESCAAPKACTPWDGRWTSMAESTTCGGRRRVATNARRTRTATTSGMKVPRVLPQICLRRQQRARGPGAPARGARRRREASPLIPRLPAHAAPRSVRLLRSPPQRRTAHARSPKPQRSARADPSNEAQRKQTSPQLPRPWRSKANRFRKSKTGTALRRPVTLVPL